ncbi:MAG: protease HtpX [Omnitrophica bacterium RIFCSPHIGHO2_02_FULL_51_18]|nr:MAG: protease HtpX [Omnitrophica bacterium RIFCSPHIGHO2_02_FULL_51_18]
MKAVNTLKTVILLVLLSGLFLAIGYLIGGQNGMYFAFMMSLLMNFGAYWFSDKIVLAMHKAKPIKPQDSSGVYEIVEELCKLAKLPTPKVYLIPERTPNAFATGRNPSHAAVAVTDGILRILNKRELRGVLAHEISHIQNRDILVSTIVAAFASAIMYLAHMLQWAGMMGHGRSREGGRGINPIVMLVTIVLAPLVATLIQAAVSRTREYMADESGAHVSEDPEALASALEKISNPALIKGFQKDEMLPDMQPAFAHLYIVNHFSGESVMSWFSTHPPVKERVKRLLSMGKK